MEKISVIVPVYKVEAYICRCVDTILSQSYSDFELILVDDGSPDNSGAICDKYAEMDSRIRVIHQKNSGLSAARNTGLEWVFANSSSQWICFVDSDDWVHRDYLRILYEAVHKTNCKLGSCMFMRTVGESLPQRVEEGYHVLEAEDYCCDRSDGRMPSVAWAKLYHRDLFQFMRFPVGKLHEDEFLTYRLAFQAGQIACSQAPLYAYFQNSQGIMQSKWSPRRMDALDAFSQQMEFAYENGYPHFLKKSTWLFLYTSAEQVHQADWVNQKRIKKNMREVIRFGKREKILPECDDMMWIYEQLYPFKKIWRVFFRLKRRMVR